MKVYKGTDKDMKCRGMQYEVGKTYEADGAVRCGSVGLHSCKAPFDVLKYYGLKDSNRYFEAEADGKISKDKDGDSKIASSKLTLKAEIGLPGLIKAQAEYTREMAERGGKNGNYSNLAGGNYSNLAGGFRSNLAGGNYSNLAGGFRSNLAGSFRSNLAGGDDSNLAGGDDSNLAGGDDSNLAGGNYSNLAGGFRSNLAGGFRSNLAGGDDSNLAGGFRSNLAGGDDSNLAGGDDSLIIGRNGCKAKGGMNSVIVLTAWERIGDEYKPTAVKAEIVDGEKIKPDTWYTLKDGEFVEAMDNET